MDCTKWDNMTVPFIMGPVGHFGLAVRDTKGSPQWFVQVLGLRKEFVFEEGVAVGNDHFSIRAKYRRGEFCWWIHLHDIRNGHIG